MNMTPSEAVALVNELKPLVANEDVDVVFCVPAIDIIPAMEAAKGSNISNNHAPRRDRKLLLNRRELDKLQRAGQDKGSCSAMVFSIWKNLLFILYSMSLSRWFIE